MADEEPVVRVTLSAIYERVVAVESSVAELKTTLPSHVSMTKAKQNEYESRLNSHADRIDEAETRLTRLEAAQRPQTPWYTVVGGVVGILTGIATVITLLTILSRIP